MKRASLLLLLALLQPTAVLAQDDTPVQRTPPEPAGRTDGFLEGVAFELDVSQDESLASAELGGYFRSQRPTSEPNTRVTQYNGNWFAKATLPIGGNDDLTSSSTLDALRNGPKVSVGLSFFRFVSAAQNLNSEPFRQAMRDAVEECITVESDDSVCTDRLDPDFAIRYLGRAPVNRILYEGIWRAGFDASLGIDRFEFVQPGTLTEREDTEVGFSAGGFVAYYPPNGTNAVFGRLEYQNAFQAPDDAVVCRTIVVDPDSDCVFAAPGPPEHVERLNLSGEYRQAFDLRRRNGSVLGVLAVSPRVTRDVLSHDFSAELPIYFLPAGNSAIAPGIRLAYAREDGEDEVTFGVFLRVKFSLTE